MSFLWYYYTLKNFGLGCVCVCVCVNMCFPIQLAVHCNRVTVMKKDLALIITHFRRDLHTHSVPRAFEV